MNNATPLFAPSPVSYSDHAKFAKMEDACNKDASYKIDTEQVKRRARFCLSENGTGDGAHTGALASFLRLYSGHSFLDQFPTVAVASGHLLLSHVDHVRRAIILQTWSNVRLRLNIPEDNIETFIFSYGKSNEFSEELNLLAALVAQTEALMDGKRRDFSFSKQVFQLKQQQYTRLMLNLKKLISRGRLSDKVHGYSKRHDNYF